jgi:hypothetical protein|nr:MAG TPA: hypothetical protein [Bacteriophage sp.]
MFTLQEWAEPTWNENVLAFSIMLKELVKTCGLKAKTVHPVVSTMLPKANKKLKQYIHTWCPTEKLANQVLEIADKLGYRWSTERVL